MNTQNNEHYCLKVYFHVIRRSNGTGGQSVSAVNQAFQILNDDFNPHSISFQWDNSINYIDNNSYFNNPSQAIFSVNNSSDGIDIYLFNDSAPMGGLANGVGGSSEFYVAGNYQGQSLTTSHILSHEMGHVLFLWHTHHGSPFEPMNCPELVNGSNSTTCGDYIADTPADPFIGMNVNSSCQWLGSGTDANGDPYAPDTHNIMSYSTPGCMSYFTPLQGVRMRNAIQTLPYLQQALANCCEGTELDLYIKDCETDYGQEPSGCVEFWDSPDIWVRNNQDGQLQNQNPVYRTNGAPNYIYVRVRNRSCVASAGNEPLKVHWAKANTSYAWPEYWDGTVLNQGNIPLSEELPAVNIPVIQPGEQAIVVIPWVVPNPADYSNMDEPWHYCLLARIDSSNDPMTFPEIADSGTNIINNNNIAQKNVSIVNPSPGNPIGAIVGVGNTFPVARDFILEFKVKPSEPGKLIYKEAEVTVTLDERLLSTWEKGGGILSKMKQLSDDTFLITGDNASFGQLSFEPEQIDLLSLKFNFLTSEITEKDRYTYYVVQKDMEGNVIGGETYEIRKDDNRDLFFAEIEGSTEVNKNEPVVLNAMAISEPAIYNWYDSDGELVHEGIDFVTSVAIGENYKLEVIALSDGYKDYSEVELTLKPNSIETVYPNPASNVITINYKVNEGNAAYLSITGVYMSNISHNYILNIDQDEITIDLSNYAMGAYVITLVTDGVISDSENLIVK